MKYPSIIKATITGRSADELVSVAEALAESFRPYSGPRSISYGHTGVERASDYNGRSLRVIFECEVTIRWEEA